MSRIASTTPILAVVLSVSFLLVANPMACAGRMKHRLQVRLVTEDGKAMRKTKARIGVLAYQSGKEGTRKRAFIPEGGTGPIFLPKPGLWVLEVESSLACPYAGRQEVEVKGKDTEVLLRLKKARILEVNGRLVTEAGEPVYPAKIFLFQHGKSSSSRTAEVERNGTFSFRVMDGTKHFLRARSNGIAGGMMTVDLPDAKTLENRWDWVVGKGNLLAKVNISYAKKEVLESVRQSRSAVLLVRQWYSTPGASSGLSNTCRFTIKEDQVLLYDHNLPQGEYDIEGIALIRRSAREGLTQTKETILLVQSGKTALNIVDSMKPEELSVTIGTPPQYTCRGRVAELGAETVVPGVQITFNPCLGDTEVSEPVSVSLDKEGKFEVKLPRQNYICSVTAPGYSNTGLRIRLANDMDLDIPLAKACDVSGRLEGPKGTSVSGALVRFVHDGKTVRSARTAVDGTFRITRIAPNRTYGIAVSKEQLPPLFDEWTRKDGTQITLTMSEGVRVQGSLQGFADPKGAGTLVFVPKTFPIESGASCKVDPKMNFKVDLSTNTYSVGLVATRDGRAKYYALGEVSVTKPMSGLDLEVENAKGVPLEQVAK